LPAFDGFTQIKYRKNSTPTIEYRSANAATESLLRRVLLVDSLPPTRLKNQPTLKDRLALRSRSKADRLMGHRHLERLKPAQALACWLVSSPAALQPYLTTRKFPITRASIPAQ
jgi:hypothetical protein